MQRGGKTLKKRYALLWTALKTLLFCIGVEITVEFTPANPYLPPLAPSPLSIQRLRCCQEPPEATLNAGGGGRFEGSYMGKTSGFTRTKQIKITLIANILEPESKLIKKRNLNRKSSIFRSEEFYHKKYYIQTSSNPFRDQCEGFLIRRTSFVRLLARS